MAQARHGGAHAVRREDGLALFAGIMLVIIGVFHLAVAVATLFQESFAVVLNSYVFSYDVTVWGWVHLALGAVAAVAGAALLTGLPGIPVPAVIVVGLSALAAFLFIPYQPLWSLLIIAVDVTVVWALAVHNRPGEADDSPERARRESDRRENGRACSGHSASVSAIDSAERAVLSPKRRGGSRGSGRDGRRAPSARGRARTSPPDPARTPGSTARPRARAASFEQS
ncbi:hypothetical protein [Saccharopolyspora gloriosae]|uniref:DUF7144 family membrane protein n=1 Tax=Saccharopolyspora gloriosae TaxID=455344 RepID=UPI001FB57DD6|nr:hypothetical protein [Saccharopolyspora gloriosae]